MISEVLISGLQSFRGVNTDWTRFPAAHICSDVFKIPLSLSIYLFIYLYLSLSLYIYIYSIYLSLSLYIYTYSISERTCRLLAVHCPLPRYKFPCQTLRWAPVTDPPLHYYYTAPYDCYYISSTITTLRCPTLHQIPITNSGMFGPNPWNILAPPSNYLFKKGFWATQPLEKVLWGKILWWELGVYYIRASCLGLRAILLLLLLLLL